ncbi:MAG: lipopolysaccharide transport periplasmic protein LptA [Desulfobacteraceae bacterium]|nr:lipopolysaccharide transport periplasmic protein LptA [Desulfobacteraceae bacterium]
MKENKEGRRFFAVKLLIILLFLSVFPAHLALAAEKGKTVPAAAKTSANPAKTPANPKAMKSDSPMHVAGDRMEVNQNDRTILFEGHIVVQQDDLTITGKRLKVYAAGGAEKDDKPTMMDKVDRIEVEGDVTISQKERVATADKAVYYHQEQKIVLIGNPKVAQGRDTVEGRVITMYIAQGKSVVEGGEQAPVHAVLHPKGGSNAVSSFLQTGKKE